MVPWGNFSLPEYMVKLKSNVVPRFHLNKFQTLCTRHPRPQPGSSNHEPVERALTISYKAALWYWYNRRYLFIRTKYWVVLGPQIILQFFCHNFDVVDCDHHCITYTWTHYFYLPITLCHYFFNCRMQFWSWRVSLSRYSISLSIQSKFPPPLFQKKKKKIGLKSSLVPHCLGLC